MSFSEKRKHVLLQPSTAAHPSPPSHQLIFHTADTKPCENIWLRVQPPFEVGSHWQCRIPESPPHSACLSSPECWDPLAASFCTATFGVLMAERGVLRVLAMGRKERRNTVLLQLLLRVQHWAVLQRGPEHESHWAMPLQCHLPCAGIMTHCKVGRTGMSPSLGLSHSGSQCHSQVPSPPCCTNCEWHLGHGSVTGQILLLEEKRHRGIACGWRNTSVMPKACDNPRCGDTAAMTLFFISFPFFELPYSNVRDAPGFVLLCFSCLLQQHAERRGFV